MVCNIDCNCNHATTLSCTQAAHISPHKCHHIMVYKSIYVVQSQKYQPGLRAVWCYFENKNTVFISNGSSTPKEQTLGEISPSSRANSCCIIIHWFLWKLSRRLHQERELAKNSPRKNHLKNVARARANGISCQHFFVNSSWHLQFWLKTLLSCLRIHCCLYNHMQETANPLANQCRQ